MATPLKFVLHYCAQKSKRNAADDVIHRKSDLKKVPEVW